MPDETQGAEIGIYVPVSGTPTLVAARRDFELSESMDTREVPAAVDVTSRVSIDSESSKSRRAATRVGVPDTGT